MHIGPGARAAAAGLDAEPVAQHAGHQLLMHEAALAVAHAEGKDRQTVRRQRPQQFQVFCTAPGGKRPLHEVGVALPHEFSAQGFLDQQDQRSADVADHVGGARFFTRFQAAAVIVAGRGHEFDGAAARPRGRGLGHGVVPHDQHAGGARAADELVRREHDGIDLRIGRRRHLDGQPPRVP
ncbi:hypothetical protein G6F35_016220 [Rhizopus arrhizus]|nr:hypothetical protein G6F35_016220 [Rhizopus arrhizus]